LALLLLHVGRAKANVPNMGRVMLDILSCFVAPHWL